MRLACLIALLATAAAGLPGREPVSDEKFNFSISLPGSRDWKAEKAENEVKAWFRTEFADSDPVAYADVRLIVQGLTRENAKMPLGQLAAKWKAPLEGHLEHPRDRKEGTGTMGGQECWTVDVKGDYEAGIHQRTWMLARMGVYSYLLIIDRCYRAVGDDQLEGEIQEIVGSFKFLKEIKLEGGKASGGGDPPPGAGGPGPPKDPNEPKIDPELLKEEKIDEDFWRFECVKPEGMIKEPVTETDNKAGIKAKFSARKEGSGIYIWIYADTEQGKKHTLEQLCESNNKHFAESRKAAKEPLFDRKYKVPLAKDCFKVDLIGRRVTTEFETWIYAECENERQYRIQILTTGTTSRDLFKVQIEKFLKSFTPKKPSK